MSAPSCRRAPLSKSEIGVARAGERAWDAGAVTSFRTTRDSSWRRDMWALRAMQDRRSTVGLHLA